MKIEMFRRRPVMLGMRRMNGLVMTMVVMAVILAMPMAAWWSQLVNLSILLSVEIYLRWQKSDYTTLGYLINMFVIGFGRRIELSPLTPLEALDQLDGSREQSIAARLGLYVITIEVSERIPYRRYIYFLRKSQLVMFKLKL